MRVASRLRVALMILFAMSVAWTFHGPAFGEQRERNDRDDDTPPRFDFTPQDHPDDPFPALAEEPIFTVVTLPTHVAQLDGAATEEEMTPAAWVAHALDRLLIHSMHHTRTLAPLGGESLRNAISPFGSEESSEVIAATLSRHYAAPLQVGLSVDELGANRLRVAGWVRFDPRPLHDWQAELMPFELPAKPIRIDLPARALALNGSTEALYESLLDIANDAVRHLVRFSIEDDFVDAEPPLPEWESFFAWLKAYLALTVGDWERADRLMEPVLEAHPHHAAVVTYRGNSFATRRVAQLNQPAPEDPEEAQRLARESFRELEEISNQMFAAIYRSERTYPLSLMATTFIELTLERGRPGEAEYALLLLLAKRPGDMRAWGTLLTRVKLALVQRRYNRSMSGFDRVAEEAEELHATFSESWESRYLLAQVLNAIGRRARALELMAELDFDELSLDPRHPQRLPMSASSLVGLGNYHGLVMGRAEGIQAALDRFVSVRNFKPESIETNQNVFEQSARALFARLDSNRNGRIEPSEAPSLRGFDRADVTDSGNLDSFEALGYYGVLGRGPIEVTQRELDSFHYDSLAENIWSSALAWKALTGRWQIEIEAFLTGYVAKERYATWQRQADMRLRYLLEQQLNATGEDEAQPFECQRGERVLLALQSWQLTDLILAEAEDDAERAELYEQLADSRDRARHVFRHDRVMNEHLQRQAFPDRPSRFVPNPFAPQD